VDLIINAFSLDASIKELNSYLVGNGQLNSLLAELKKQNNGKKITVAVSGEQAQLLRNSPDVETLIVNNNGDFFKLYTASPETPLDISVLYNQPGAKTVLSIKGPLNKPGIYTCEQDIPLLEIIYSEAQGLKNGRRKFKALLIGGSFGAFINEKALSFSLAQSTAIFTYPLNNTLIVVDDTSCLVNLVKILTLYNQQKLAPCSGCDFCRNRLVQAKVLLETITGGLGTKESLEKLNTLIAEKEEKARCNLGKQSLLPLETALKFFGEEFTEHVTHKYCRASVCEALFLSPCTNACPAAVDLPGTIGLMQKGLFVEAVTLGRETNPFFLSCGRICEEPLCQKYCQRQTVDKSVNSRALHRYAGEIAATKAGGLAKVLDHPSLRPLISTGKKVAIVGAGPAGLSAAYFLARYGHKVTVLEKQAVAGGMLRIGIPDYRLPPELLNEEINHILSLGIEIKYNTELGKDVTLKELQEQYDAVYIAIGAHNSNTMGIPGEELPGVLSGIDFLRKVNLGEKIAVGPKVIVVGGGNVAIDAARCALRLGGKETKIVYRRSLEDMPAACEEIEAAQKEGIEILPMVNPVEIAEKGGKKLVKLQKMHPGGFDNSGRRKPEKTNEFFSLEADTVIMAIGQSPDVRYLDSTGIETKRQQIQVDRCQFSTNMEGVFAGGDCVLGPATAVEAIGHGRKAAAGIHKYLTAQYPVSFTSLRCLLKNYVGPYSCTEKPQQEPEKLTISERIKDFREVEKCYTDLQAQEEMTRCICSAKTGL